MHRKKIGSEHKMDSLGSFDSGMDHCLDPFGGWLVAHLRQQSYSLFRRKRLSSPVFELFSEKNLRPTMLSMEYCLSKGIDNVSA